MNDQDVRPPALLIATRNKGKVREARAALANLAFTFLTLDDFQDVPPVEEEGATFEENAVRKALYYAGETGLWTLADDSGLEVEALNGAPGLHSARYAGATASDQQNNAKLIAALRRVPPSKRSARFRCAVALAKPGELIATAEGMMEGLIIDQPAGTSGFGYDPHFLVPQYGMTAAELPLEHKNRISHRGRALRAIRPHLERLLP